MPDEIDLDDEQEDAMEAAWKRLETPQEQTDGKSFGSFGEKARPLTIAMLRNTPRIGFTLESPDGSQTTYVNLSPTTASLGGKVGIPRDEVIEEVSRLVQQGWRQPSDKPMPKPELDRPGMMNRYTGD